MFSRMSEVYEEYLFGKYPLFREGGLNRGLAQAWLEIDLGWGTIEAFATWSPVETSGTIGEGFLRYRVPSLATMAELDALVDRILPLAEEIGANCLFSGIRAPQDFPAPRARWRPGRGALGPHFKIRDLCSELDRVVRADAGRLSDARDAGYEPKEERELLTRLMTPRQRQCFTEGWEDAAGLYGPAWRRWSEPWNEGILTVLGDSPQEWGASWHERNIAENLDGINDILDREAKPSAEEAEAWWKFCAEMCARAGGSGPAGKKPAKEPKRIHVNRMKM